MQRILVAVLTGLCCTTSSIAPAAPSIAEDYLNPVRLGPASPPATGQQPLTATLPLRATFAAPEDAGEVYRVRIRPRQEDDVWGADEAITLILRRGDATGPELARAARPATERSLDPDLYFPLRVPIRGGETLTIELIHNGGGDGSIPVDIVTAEDGTAIPWYEVHVKAKKSRDEVFAAFFDRLNLDFPGLEETRAAVQRRDWDAAIAAYVRFSEQRNEELQRDWVQKPERPRANPDFDAGELPLLLEGKLIGKEPGQRADWRPNSNWRPRIGFEPAWDLRPWGVLRALANLYWNTNDDRVARYAVGLLTQFQLDNPNPRTSGISPPRDFWTELVAARRAPGHGVFTYGRFYFSPAFTPEERLVWWVGYHENAEFLRPSTVGGNWGFQTFEALYSYARDFPEWKVSPEWVDHGIQQLIRLTRECVRDDGTEHEAAIKYHMMCARRLFSMLRDEEAGRIAIQPETRPALYKALEGLYDHGAHMLKPDGYVVMSGDSFLENYSDEVAAVGRFIGRPDFVWIGTQGREGTPPAEVSKAFPLGGYYIMRDHFGTEGRRYEDAVHIVIHNGGSVGSHFHGDFTALNLYAGGNTLLWDPGQYDIELEPKYWNSSQHSMLNLNGWVAKREPGYSIWRATPDIDYYEGDHRGYPGYTVTRRVMFIKPRLILVQDELTGNPDNLTIDQSWHLGTLDVQDLDAPLRQRTTFAEGANLELIPLWPLSYETVRDKGLRNSEEGVSESTVLKYRIFAAPPQRFVTLLAIDFGGQATPTVAYENTATGGVTTITDGDTTYTVAFGDAGQATPFGKHTVRARAAVLAHKGDTLERAWMLDGSELRWNYAVMYQVGVAPGWCDVKWSGGRVDVDFDDEAVSLAVRVPHDQRITVRGEAVDAGVTPEGLIIVSSVDGRALVYDDLSPSFRRVTDTAEWELKSDGNPFGNTYLVHETDVGRIEAAEWTIHIDQPGTYTVEAYWPDSLHWRSEDVRYLVPGAPVETPLERAPAVRNAAAGEGGTHAVVSVDQSQGSASWNLLGAFRLAAGNHVLRIENHSPDDGRYPMFDAVRLIPYDGATGAE